MPTITTNEGTQIDDDQIVPIGASALRWPSGRPIYSQDTLSFSVLTGVRAMTQLFPLERAAEAYELMMSGKARFRAVLTTAS